MTDQQPTTPKPDPLEPVKARIRSHIDGKDLSKLPGYVVQRDLNKSGPAISPMEFSQAWAGVMRELSPEPEVTVPIEPPSEPRPPE